MFIRPMRDALAPEYLSTLVSSQYMRTKLEKVAIGTTLLNLNSTIVGDLLIPVPPIDLQLRYAEILLRLSAIGGITTRSDIAVQPLGRLWKTQSIRGRMGPQTKASIG
jgi:hypothetical protein